MANANYAISHSETLTKRLPGITDFDIGVIGFVEILEAVIPTTAVDAKFEFKHNIEKGVRELLTDSHSVTETIHQSLALCEDQLIKDEPFWNLWVEVWDDLKITQEAYTIADTQLVRTEVLKEFIGSNQIVITIWQNLIDADIVSFNISPEIWPLPDEPWGMNIIYNTTIMTYDQYSMYGSFTLYFPLLLDFEMENDGWPDVANSIENENIIYQTTLDQHFELELTYWEEVIPDLLWSEILLDGEVPIEIEAEFNLLYTVWDADLEMQNKIIEWFWVSIFDDIEVSPEIPLEFSYSFNLQDHVVDGEELLGENTIFIPAIAPEDQGFGLLDISPQIIHWWPEFEFSITNWRFAEIDPGDAFELWSHFENLDVEFDPNIRIELPFQTTLEMKNDLFFTRHFDNMTFEKCAVWGEVTIISDFEIRQEFTNTIDPYGTRGEPYSHEVVTSKVGYNELAKDVSDLSSLQYMVQILLDGRDVSHLVKSCSISYSLSNFVGEVSIAWQDWSIYHQLRIKARENLGKIRVEVLSARVDPGGPINWISQGRFMLERQDTNADFKTIHPVSWGRSETAKLSDPYCPLLNETYPTGGAPSTRATVVARQVMAAAGVSTDKLSWETMDYDILPDKYAADNATPIQVIEGLASPLGAVVTTDKTGILRVTDRYQ